jgi:cellulose synthase/poly-beta-1,6-N-acetylglucosamine synthase-like glycosyltransferase
MILSPRAFRPSSNRSARRDLSALLEILLGAAAIVLLLPAAVLFVEVLLALARPRSMNAASHARRRLAILMPAHNEALVIAESILSIIPQLGETDRLLVVADNCTDETSLIASATGAEVIIRTDLARRGKGYALDYGVRHLALDAPDIVIVIDADCRAEPRSIDLLVRYCALSNRPVQSLYLMSAGKGAGLKMRIAEFAWTIKNHARPLGLLRMGLPCQLMGTGMAFPWVCISAASLATAQIVEDLQLGIDLARAGFPPVFCPEALVTSRFPTTAEGARGQRMRWEHGHLSVILNEAPRLFWESMKSLNLNTLAMALDLSVPPLALLVLQIVLLWVASIAFWLVTKERLPLWIATAAVALVGFSVLASWSRFGRRIISMGSLALALIYSLGKIPIYLKFLFARQREWIRSKRDGKQS